jgi:cell division protein FtsW
MTAFSRTDRSLLSQWWWTVDHKLIVAAFLTAGVGVLLVSASGTAVASRIGLDGGHFVQKHLQMLGPALLVMMLASFLTPRQVVQASALMLAGCVVLMAATLFVGIEIKGARRWLHLPGVSLQPSEFAKPAFAVACAWLMSKGFTEKRFPGQISALALLALVGTLLLLQPDLGMTAIFFATWGAQVLLAGLPMAVVAMLPFLAGAGLYGAYLFLPHVRQRMMKFSVEDYGDKFQIHKSLESFANGGIFGVGPGQGTVKLFLPDAHADFVFAVAGEELGMLICMGIVVLFAFVVIRSLNRAAKTGSLFRMLAVGGLATQYGSQAFVNMASTLHLIPTKGMTLPFISYGGSSMVAVGLGLGFILALTRSNHEEDAVR